MPYTLRAPSPTDSSPLATLMTTSRWSDPHWRSLFAPSTTLTAAIAQTSARNPRNLTSGRDGKRHQIAIDDETGEIVGYARWILPPTEGGAGEGRVIWPEAIVREAISEEKVEFERMYKSSCDSQGRMALMNWTLMPHRNTPLEVADAEFEAEHGPYMTLDYLSVAPAWQRRGIGRMLLRKGLEVADREGLSLIHI